MLIKVSVSRNGNVVFESKMGYIGPSLEKKDIYKNGTKSPTTKRNF